MCQHTDFDTCGSGVAKQVSQSEEINKSIPVMWLTTSFTWEALGTALTLAAAAQVFNVFSKMLSKHR